MSRVLVTGARGFAGRHLVAACQAAGDRVTGASRSTGADLRDPAAARAAVQDSAPDVVYHLAAQAHVGRSWSEPWETLSDNQRIALNVLEAVREAAPAATVLLAGSGEVYGPPERLPVGEDAPLNPQNPYAVSKAAVDLLGGVYAAAHGLRVIRVRAFNHAGPGQGPGFAVAVFARQMAEGLAAGDDPIRIVTGNPGASRDYTDVRCVVRAYRALAARAAPGIYNVCSGRPASAAELVARLGRVCGVRVEHVVDPALVRAHEVMEIRGSYDRLAAATGWAPEIDLDRTLADTVAWWRDLDSADGPE